MSLIDDARSRVDEKFDVRNGKVGEKSTGALLLALAAALEEKELFTPERILLRRPDGTPKTNDEILAEAAALDKPASSR